MVLPSPWDLTGQETPTVLAFPCHTGSALGRAPHLLQCSAEAVVKFFIVLAEGPCVFPLRWTLTITCISCVFLLEHHSLWKRGMGVEGI